MRGTTLFLAGCLVAVGADVPKGEPLTPKQLKEAALEAIKDKDSPPTDPTLDVTESEVTLRLGGLPRPSAKRTPLEYVLEERIIIELFRARPPKSNLEVKWAPVLEKAEEVADRQLKIVQDGTLKPDDHTTALKKGHQEFEALFKDQLKPVAGKRPVIINRDRAPGRFEVTVKADPEGGTIFYLPRIQYELLKAKGGLDDDQNWYEVVANPIRISGSFVFRGKWKDKTRITGIVQVDKKDTVTVRRGD